MFDPGTPIPYFLMIAVVVLGVVGMQLMRKKEKQRPAEEPKLPEREQRVLDAVRSEPTPIADVAGGSVRVLGEVVASDELLTSPCKGTPCVGYVVEIEIEHPQGVHPRFVQLFRGSAWRPFVIDDGTGRAQVRNGALEILATRHLHEFPEVLPASFAAIEGAPRDRGRYWVNETVLAVGDRISVIGSVTTGETDGAPITLDGGRTPSLVAVSEGEVERCRVAEADLRERLAARR